jgi:ubiquinone/menaquinone biosynthesis C-methylase UbiE
MDFAKSLLMRAKSLAAEVDVPPHWLRGDFRRLPLRSAFFAGAILIDAFGFFETDDENEGVLMEIRRVLARGGRLGMKVVNGARILADFRVAGREEREGVVVTISRQLKLNPARMIEKVSVRGSRGNGEYERHQRLYRPDELSGAMERTGFTEIELFATTDSATLDPGTSDTIWAFGRRGAN